MVKSASARSILVTASDCRLGTPQSDLEQRFGDAAAAVLIGDSDPMAVIVDSTSLFDEFSDEWRMEGDQFVRSWEERFSIAQGYMRVTQQALSEFLKGRALTPKDFSKVVLCGPDPRSQAVLAKGLGFDIPTQLQPLLFDTVGDSGTGASLLMLAAVLERAKAGDRILLVNYGDGSDILIFEVTERIESLRIREGMEKRLARRIYINYENYLSWRDLLPVEFPRRPESQVPSVSSRWRERKRIFPLYAVRCRKCGMVQYPPQRVCINCGSKDEFDDYKLSDKKANIFTLATDRLATTKAPVAVNALVEFEGGGRMICEMTDCDSTQLKIGMPVEMTFRKLRQFPGMVDYFWKARPIGMQG
jgi:uncharacterized OB-fold protein